eukprot:CAMPEP_0117674478 /NCGR_PEP_ID=MMETSP0804-20121206/15062_1 /TAXON_ID=1074897 /ORGANISM="Tetraselmis astigmatica, Strain CCMP880" /LENGTH=627 /DNA_ID=CAMNT_0005483355 /DNA_START=254 /DNA_END=2137 /DNA_ORIENTATION=-
MSPLVPMRGGRYDGLANEFERSGFESSMKGHLECSPASDLAASRSSAAAAAGAVPLLPESVTHPQLQTLIRKSQTEWLKCNEVVELLSSARKEGFPISQGPAVQPEGGSLFLYDRVSVKYFRNDGHDWKKKGDGKAVRETHEKLKLDQVVMLNCYYAHAISPENLQRRCYWLLDSSESLVLVHYLSVGQDSSRPNVMAEKKYGEQINAAGLSPCGTEDMSIGVLDSWPDNEWDLREEAESKANFPPESSFVTAQGKGNEFTAQGNDPLPGLSPGEPMQRASSQLADQLAGLPFPDVFPDEDAQLDNAVFQSSINPQQGLPDADRLFPADDISTTSSDNSTGTSAGRSLHSPTRTLVTSVGYPSDTASLGEILQQARSGAECGGEHFSMSSLNGCQDPLQALDAGALDWVESTSGAIQTTSDFGSTNGSLRGFRSSALESEDLPSTPVHFSSSEVDLWGMMAKVLDPTDHATPAAGAAPLETGVSSPSTSFRLLIEEVCPSRLQETGGQKILMAVSGLDNFDFSSGYISINLGGVLIDPKCIQNGVISFLSPNLQPGAVRLTLLDTSREEWVQLCEPLTMQVVCEKRRIPKVHAALDAQVDRNGQLALIQQLLHKRSATDIATLSLAH